MTFDQMVQAASSRGASDIHLRAGHVPLVRVDGLLERWTNVAPVSAAPSKPSPRGCCRRRTRPFCRTSMKWISPGRRRASDVSAPAFSVSAARWPCRCV
jgi:hypothetical protein